MLASYTEVQGSTLPGDTVVSTLRTWFIGVTLKVTPPALQVHKGQMLDLPYGMTWSPLCHQWISSHLEWYFSQKDLPGIPEDRFQSVISHELEN